MRLNAGSGTAKQVITSLVVLAMAFGTLPAYARTSATDAWTQPDESDLTNHGHYVNHDGHNVHSPSRTKDGAVRPGATAHCADGSYSFSQHHSGTCSRHGGVAEWE
ncbi:DUF3761 domain-containing protein [Paraburkholderia phymatum]|uniref:DUF3761 domain-containing protein n=1 Tax=Paraburkholderia phymatum (strain DSM 17167 / CIP 108236 / LMG 21445 / STM815) TaxID=391038 RepID=B2JV29_PARP8|nr:DUF3761 domain-containing protein [Paraburkholderia phymatum]ACC74806.1 hypothetical protein Bphy_5738 [Paraburkholderia phymatum STM815]